MPEWDGKKSRLQQPARRLGLGDDGLCRFIVLEEAAGVPSTAVYDRGQPFEIVQEAALFWVQDF